MLPKGLLKEHAQALSMLMRILDVLAVAVSGVVAFSYKFGEAPLPRPYWGALLISSVLVWFVFSFFQIYESVRTQSYWQYISRLGQALGVVLLLLAGIAFITKTGDWYSRSWFILWALGSLGFLTFFRFSILMVLRLMRAYGLNERCVIIMGAGEVGQKLAAHVHQALWTGLRVVAFFEEDMENKPASIGGVPVLKVPDDLSAYLKQSKTTIDEVWIALPLRAEAEIKAILYALRHHTLTIRYALDVFGLDLQNHSMTYLAGVPTLNFNESPMVGLNRLIKALEDRVIAACLLLLVSPVLILIALGVKMSSRGPVLFKQARHGWDGRIIRVYKFRTMVEHEEPPGQVTQAVLNDARVTRFGRFLRKTSLDELPQFFNVLQGKMSIVGPRPHAVAHNEFYKDSIKAYMQRHKVKPGITGWAQVNGWRGETEALDKMKKRVEYDLYYIENWSLGLDLKIILMTVFRGFVNKNAY